MHYSGAYYTYRTKFTMCTKMHNIAYTILDDHAITRKHVACSGVV